MKPILLIGATGTVGSQVFSQLLKKGIPVRALVRNPAAGRLPPQVEVFRGDLTIPETLDRCLDGIDAVFLVWTAPAATVPQVLEKIANRASRVVFLSAPIKTPHPLFQQPNPLRILVGQIEQQIEASNLEWTFLRPGMFAANSLNWWAPQIRTGDVVRWPYLSVPTAPVDERDIAEIAVRALSEDGHHRAEYVLTGPQSLTQFEQISTIARAIGRPLRIEDISPDEARTKLLPTMPLVAINMLLNAWAAAADQPALVTSTFAGITGHPPRPFNDWVADHSSRFRA